MATPLNGLSKRTWGGLAAMLGVFVTLSMAASTLVMEPNVRAVASDVTREAFRDHERRPHEGAARLRDLDGLRSDIGDLRDDVRALRVEVREAIKR